MTLGRERSTNTGFLVLRWHINGENSVQWQTKPRVIRTEKSFTMSTDHTEH
jgi:hypothetical protein